MNKAGFSAVEIAKLIGRSRQTVYNLKKLDEDKMFVEPDKNTRKPTFDLEDLNTYFKDNKFDFNYEIAVVFKKGKSTIHRWRHKLGFNRKKAKTTYKESDENLKKTSNQI
jgi:transposase